MATNEEILEAATKNAAEIARLELKVNRLRAAGLEMAEALRYTYAAISRVEGTDSEYRILDADSVFKKVNSALSNAVEVLNER